MKPTSLIAACWIVATMCLAPAALSAGPGMAQVLASTTPLGPAGLLLRQEVGPLTVGSDACPSAADWDGDGDLDIFVGSGSGDVIYFQNIGSNEELLFAGGEVVLPAGRNGGAGAIDVVDWDADGMLDLLVSRGGRLLAHLGLDAGGQPTFDDGWEVPGPQGRSVLPDAASVASAVRWADDADVALLIGTGDGRVLLAKPCEAENGTRAFVPEALTGGGVVIQVPGPARPVAGDWDGDGKLDVLLADAHGRIRLLRGAEDAAAFDLLAEERVSVAPEWDPSLCGISFGGCHLAPADLDADGTPELLLGLSDGFVALAEDLSDGSPTGGLLRQQNAPVDAGRYSAPASADWDGDGVADLIVGNARGHVMLFRGVAGKPFEYEAGTPITLDDKALCVADEAGESGLARPLPVDYDGDGDTDLLVGDAQGRLTWFANRGGEQPWLRKGVGVSAGGRPVKRGMPISAATIT